MKILAGALAILLLATGFMGWRLKVAWEDVATARGDAQQAQQVAGEQRQQAELLNQRLVTLDSTLKLVAAGTQANSEQLDQTVDAIDAIGKTEGVPHDQSVLCLDVRVPVQLDERLR
jgi:hypothetical protein